MHKDTPMCGPRGLEFGTNYLCTTRVSTSPVKVCEGELRTERLRRGRGMLQGLGWICINEK